jgi:hypothetical protein
MILASGFIDGGKGNPVRNNGAFTPPFLLRNAIYIYVIPVNHGGAF